MGNNGSPQCTYAAGRASVVVNVDHTAQPYFILERTSVEAGQAFSSSAAVEVDHVPGVGLDAFWYPAAGKFQTTDGVNLLSVTATEPHATSAALRQVAEAAARAHLGKLHHGNGY